jgi:MFS family permease
MSEDTIQSAEHQFSRKQIVWGLVAIFAVYGTVAYAVQSMMVARPKIAADLNGLSLYGWSMSIPALVMALVTIIFGKFSDMYGRRIMLMISLTAALIGNILCALSPDFVFLIIASAIAALGAGAMMPLVFAVVGDLFPPSERGKWVGLLSIPLGVFTLTGPVLGGYILETWHWRYLYWLAVPLLVFCLFTVPLGVPSRVNRDSKPEIDVKGCIWAALALSTSIIGFSLTKDHPWLSTHVIGLLGFSLVCWIIFLRVESGAKEPVLDPAVLRNRSFSTVALATFFSSFGTMAMMMYFPMFLQGVQEISATENGLIITPYGVLAAFMGVPAGYIIDRSGRFKWMYIAGYGVLTMSMFALILFNAGTFWGWSLAVALLAGLGYGVIPTINTVVVQNAVPKRLMGVAMGAIFFFLGVGNAVSPAVLDSAMNVTYSKVLSRSLPEGLSDIADEKIMDALDDPQVLLSGSAYEDLEKSLQVEEGTGPQLFQQTVDATRYSLEASMRTIFTIGAILMLLAFLIICTVPGKFSGTEAQQPVPQETEKAGSE